MGFDIELRRVRSQTRPPKRVILVKPTKKLDKLLDVFEYMSSVWGGYYTILVPTDGKNIEHMWLSQINDFDPDIIARHPSLRSISGSVADSILKSCAPFRGLFEETIGGFPGAFGPYEVSMNTVLRSRSQDWIGNPEIKQVPSQAKIHFYSKYGHLDEEFVEVLHYSSAEADAEGDDRIDVRDLKFGRSRHSMSHLVDLSYNLEKRLSFGPAKMFEKPLNVSARMYDGHPYDDIFPRLPLVLTRFGIEDHRFAPFLQITKPVVCVVGSAMADFILAHNLERLGYVSHWIPLDSPDAKNCTKNLWMFACGLAYNYCNSVTHDPVSPFRTNVISVSLPIEQVRTFIPWLAEISAKYYNRISFENEASTYEERDLMVQKERKAVRSNFLESLSLFEPDKLELFPIYPVFEDSENWETLQFLRGRSLTFPEIKLSPLIKSHNSRHLKWISDVDIENYQHLRRFEVSPPEMNAEDLGLDNMRTASRISRMGLSFLWPQTGMQPLGTSPCVRLLDSDEVFSRVFGSAGYEVESSDKGRFYNHVLSMSGSLESLARVLSDERMKVLQRAYIPEKFGGQIDGAEFIYDDQRYYFHVSEIFRLLSQRGEGEIESFIGSLLESGHLQYGYLLKCSKCLQAKWYSPNEVANIFICRRCGSEQLLLPEADPLAVQGGPVPYYRLNEVFYQFLNNGCDVTARSLNELQSHMGKEMLYLAESQMIPTNSENPLMEVDFIASWHGLLTLGECRRNWKPSGDDRDRMKAKLKKYKAVFHRLRPDILAICSLEPLTDNQFITGFRELAKQYNVNIVTVLPEESEETDRIVFL